MAVCFGIWSLFRVACIRDSAVPDIVKGLGYLEKDRSGTTSLSMGMRLTSRMYPSQSTNSKGACRTRLRNAGANPHRESHSRPVPSHQHSGMYHILCSGCPETPSYRHLPKLVDRRTREVILQSVPSCLLHSFAIHSVENSTSSSGISCSSRMRSMKEMPSGART